MAHALANNSTLKELDVSSNVWKERGRDKGDGPGFVQELAVGLIDNGAMSKFTFSGDYSDSKPVTMTTTMTEADFSGKALGVSGSMMVAAFLPKCQ